VPNDAVRALATPAAVFAIAYLTTQGVVPLMTRIALRRKLLDHPGSRHRHASAVPRLGGVAIFAGLLAAFLASAISTTQVGGSTPAMPPLAPALALACAILFLVGLLDDIRGVPPIQKLLAQTGAALIVCYAGFDIDVISLPPRYELHFGALSILVTVLWLVGVSNAYNLIDGLDGLAGGVGLIALLTASASGAILGSHTTPLYAIALAGALLAFLRYNVPPAKVFLGDSGSLVVGFLLAVLSVKGATRGDGVVYALVPIFALSYLLLDTGIAILRRWLRGVPLSRADDRHIHHQMRALGLSPRRAIGVIYLHSFVIAALGLSITFVPPRMTIAIAAAGGATLLLIMVYGVRWLEYHEFLEAGASVASAARKARTVIQDKINARDVATLIRGAATLDDVSEILVQSAKTFRFVHMQLGSSERTLPQWVRTGLWKSQYWKLEYPIAPRLHLPGVAQDSVVLAIWCSTDIFGRPAGAERVAQILAPAIASWLTMAGRLQTTAERAVVGHIDVSSDDLPSRIVPLPNTSASQGDAAQL
jgi:UDP-GlcNAc:undecaprenyl-phosphate/decaprenyl-phosphate GlcNAc-1-phosphate transferase